MLNIIGKIDCLRNGLKNVVYTNFGNEKIQSKV